MSIFVWIILSKVIITFTFYFIDKLFWCIQTFLLNVITWWCHYSLFVWWLLLLWGILKADIGNYVALTFHRKRWRLHLLLFYLLSSLYFLNFLLCRILQICLGNLSIIKQRILKIKLLSISVWIVTWSIFVQIFWLDLAVGLETRTTDWGLDIGGISIHLINFRRFTSLPLVHLSLFAITFSLLIEWFSLGWLLLL